MPTMRRVMCGTTRPTKPTGPATATADPARIRTASPARRRMRESLPPRPMAMSSPKESRVTERETDTARMSPRMVQGTTPRIAVMRMPLMPPAVQ